MAKFKTGSIWGEFIKCEKCSCEDLDLESITDVRPDRSKGYNNKYHVILRCSACNEKKEFNIDNDKWIYELMVS
jgi:hypothetical protein